MNHTSRCDAKREANAAFIAESRIAIPQLLLIVRGVLAVLKQSDPSGTDVRVVELVAERILRDRTFSPLLKEAAGGKD